jgi:hypothetical protein
VGVEPVMFSKFSEANTDTIAVSGKIACVLWQIVANVNLP